jgi:putative addiction module component (TIGR02574 family)
MALPNISLKRTRREASLAYAGIPAARRLASPLGLSRGGVAGVSFASIQRGGVLMSSQLEAVEAQALKLTAEERAQLADRLIASLFEDKEIEEAWAVEVERRIEEIENGRSKLIPAAEAIARARAAIK